MEGKAFFLVVVFACGIFPFSSVEANVRLANGVKTRELYVGILQVNHNNEWGTVCDDEWTINNTKVVCRQLGYRQGIAKHLGEGSGTIWLDDVACTGDENSVINCRHPGWGEEDCDHSEDIGIVCFSAKSPNLDFRWRQNPFLNAGRLEVRYHGTWGTLCADNIGLGDGHVICRMMGYNQASIVLRTSLSASAGAIKFSLTLSCNGNENSTKYCNRAELNKINSCDTNLESWIVCKSASERSDDGDLAVRLVNGSTPNQGRVEVRYYGVWGTVCDDIWDLADAYVVCRMLNYSKALWAGTAKVSGSGHILLDDVRCRGNEKSLAECRSNGFGKHNCGHGEDAGVKCGNVTQEEASVTARLVQREENHIGFVEVNYNGTWRPVCDDTWDISDAHVVCRMLGYKAALAAVKRYRRKGAGLWMGGVHCSGTEKSISECFHRGWWNTQCPGYFTAAALCQHSDDFSDVEIRLDGGSLPNSGRVAVRYGNVWGTICLSGLGMNDAKVICRMLGYPGASRVHQASRPGNGTIWLSNLACSGTEKSIADCQHPGWGQTTCSHYYDAGVVCEKVSVPRFQINDSNAVTESTAFLMIGETGVIDEALNSTYQVVVERVHQSVISSSLEQKHPNLPAVLEHFAMVTDNGSASYVTAEMEYSASPSNVTVGDGLEYNGYYNAPLEPGCIYKVYLRIVTRTSSGRNVYGDSSFVAFSTKQRIGKGASASKWFQAPGSVVIVLSVALGICIAFLIGLFNLHRKLRKEKADNKAKSQGTAEGTEMSNVHAPMYGNTEGHYQPLLHLSPPQSEESYYANVSVSEIKQRQMPNASLSGNTSTGKKEESLYEDVDDVTNKLKPIHKFK